MKKDLQYIQLATQLAGKAKGKTSPNPLVGALVVKNDRVIAKGWHQRCGGSHAEVIALRKAGRRAKGATLYVTLEPCCHHGRTPPCVDQIIESGIKKVVIGMKDPNPLVRGRSIRKLQRSGVKTAVGFCQKELEELNESFLKYIKHKTPFVVVKTAQTLDGKIATATGQSKWITSEKARRYAYNKRNEFDAILVGVNTVLKDNPSLNAGLKSKKIKKVVLDTSLKMSLNARLFRKTDPQDCFVATTRKAKPSKIKLFQQKGINVIMCPTGSGGVSLRWLFRQLAKREIAHVLIEGGAKVIGTSLKEKLVDKMHIYIAPKILGDQGALSSIDGLKTINVNQAVKLTKIKINPIEDNLFIEGYVHRNR